MSNSKYQSQNSFYHLGDMDILTFSQDEKSLLWKFYLSTPEHYVVSREFDKSKGMYANAPDGVVRRGLMDFSASMMGSGMSMFGIMDMFIDRCFDDSAFGPDTVNSVWMSIDHPSYMEMEDILSTYSSRIIWACDGNDEKHPALGELMNRTLYHTPNRGAERDALVDDLLREFSKSRITSVFLNEDSVAESVLVNSRFDGFPIFKGEFSSKDPSAFTSFRYVGH